MSDPRETKPDQPPSPDNGSANPVTVNPFLYGIVWFCAVAWGVTWKWTLYPFILNTYSVAGIDYRGNAVRNPNGLSLLIGAILSLGAGIGVGYQLGWQMEQVWYVALAKGTVTAAFMAFLAWPGLFRLSKILRLRISRWLWSFVNIDAKTASHYDSTTGQRVEDGNPAWFSKVLMWTSSFEVGGACAYLFYAIACHVQANQETFGTLGGILAIGLSVILSIVGLVAFVASLFFFGKRAFWLWVIGIGVAYWLLPVTAFFHGLYANLSGNDWGIWGYVPGALLGLVVAGLAFWAAIALLWVWRIRVVALVYSLGATYLLAGYTNELIAQLPVASWSESFGPLSYLSATLPWITYLAETYLFAGIVFPAFHIFVTRVLKVLSKLADITELMKDVYGEKRGGYREWFLQIVNFALVGLTIYFAPHWVTVVSGWTAPVAVWGVTGVLSLLVYIFGYLILEGTGSWPIGAVSAIYGGLWMHEFYTAHNWPAGQVGAWGGSVAFAAAVYAVGFPVGYLVLRTILHYPAKLSRDFLVTLHENVCEAVGQIWDNLFDLHDKAYNDSSPYHELFVHLSNIVIACGVAYGSVWGGEYLGMAGWLTGVSTVVLTIASYSLVAQLLLRIGIWPIGFLVASILGLWFGEHVHAAQNVDWGNWRYFLSIGLGALFAAFIFGIVVPIIYLAPNWIAGGVSADNKLRKGLMSVYARIWTPLSSFVTQVRAARKSIEAQWGAIQKSFADQWNAIQNKNKKDKK